MISTDFDNHESDVYQDQSGYPALPIASAEAIIYDTSRVPPGAIQMELASPTGTYNKSCPHIRGANIGLFFDQAVTVRLYWLLGGVWTIVNGAGAGNALTASTAYAKLVPFGGDGTRIAYLAGVTPPTFQRMSIRLSKFAASYTIP